MATVRSRRPARPHLFRKREFGAGELSPERLAANERFAYTGEGDYRGSAGFSRPGISGEDPEVTERARLVKEAKRKRSPIQASRIASRNKQMSASRDRMRLAAAMGRQSLFNQTLG